MRARSRLALVALLTVGVLPLVPMVAPTGPAAETLTRHSGIVEEVDQMAGTIVLSEMGPWRAPGGATAVSRRTIHVTPATQFLRVERRGPAPGEAWPGGYVEVPLEPWAVEEGQFVTVQAERRDGQLVARRVMVASLQRS